ncbi:MAG TPA: MobF family relaxase [Acidimicrobiales bacterium]|nr:MobF family relaxase [Acidimicrobiales bacterium]
MATTKTSCGPRAHAPSGHWWPEMLSIGKLTPGRAGYYIDQVHAGADEYYLADEAEPGQWLGKAALLLGLSGRVEAEDFRAVLEARHPLTGESLGVPTTTASRLSGFDLCFSAPKSVSVAWALAGHELSSAIAGAHDRAVADALGAMEAEALRARRGAGGNEVITTGGFVAAAFPHRSSRAGDPQLHSHVVIANATPGDDGRWSAPYGSRLYAWAKTTGYLYQAALRAELSEIGFGFGPVTKGAAEIEGVPRALTAAFSSRRADIEAVLEANGGSSRGAAEVAALSTRQAKALVPGLSELRSEWVSRAQALGVSRGFVEELAHMGPGLAPEPGELAKQLLGPDGLTAHATSFDRRAVLQALAAAHESGARVEELRSAAGTLLASPQVVELATPARCERRWSTFELVELEAAVLKGAMGRSADALSLVRPEHLAAALDQRPTLSDEQRQMVEVITTSGAGVQIVVGRAGAGKTFALDAAREVWEAAGHKVIGTALAARAAAQLEAGSGIASTTLDRLLMDLESPGPGSGFAPNSAVVVDEAGMVGTRKLARLLGHAEAAGAQVVLVGDPRQLPEVDAGGAFSALAKQLPVVELRENRRQAEVWERGALAELRAGSLEAALAEYGNAGRVLLAPDADEARRAMAEHWWHARSDGDEAMMYALRRGDVDQLNALARSHLEAAGVLGEGRLVAAGREFAVGDRVMLLRNDRSLGVRNGEAGVVVALDTEQRWLVLDDGRRLPAEYLDAGHVGHGYASTVHKAQGATVDRAFLLGSERLYREAGYVGMSRGRLSNEIFVVASDLADANDALAEQLRASRAQHLAVSQLEPSSSGPSKGRLPRGLGQPGRGAPRRDDDMGLAI